jgi:Uma2 family endonuclease
MPMMDLVGIDKTAAIRMEPDEPMSPDEFFDFCQANSLWQIERSADGEIIIMPPAGSESGYSSLEVSGQLRAWARNDSRGRAFDSSTGFTLPNGAVRSPDASWVSKARTATLTSEQKKKFAPVCPEFVVEIKSPSDSLPRLKRKMHEWIDNGALLGWLILPETETVQIFRPGLPPEARQGISALAGEGPVEGFELDLTDIWDGF